MRGGDDGLEEVRGKLPAGGGRGADDTGLVGGVDEKEEKNGLNSKRGRLAGTFLGGA